MIEIQVEKSHTLGRHNAKQAMKKIFADPSMEMDFAKKWDGFKCVLSGEGLEGEVIVDDSKVLFALRVSILVRQMGVTSKDIEATISQRLDAALA